MRIQKLGAAVAAVMCAAGVMVYGQVQPVVDTTGNVDWGKRTITVKGIGAPNPEMPEAAQRPAAVRAAQMMALRNALETIKGIQISSETTIENFMVTDEYATTSIDGFIKGFKFEPNPHYMSDGSVEISVTVPLDGPKGLGCALYGPGKGDSIVSDKPAVTKMSDPVAAIQKPAVPAAAEPSTTPVVNDKPQATTAPQPAAQTAVPVKPVVFTGLIIDAKGLEVKPAMAPKVFDESGNEVYGSLYVSREFAVKYGMSGYAKSVENAAKSADRIGKTPAKFKAIKASGANKCDVVLSNADADAIRSSAKNLKFLQECRVIIVVD
jgi:hypothetical protein